jgi:predicted transposase/invertase (TIGR01784 family)
MIEFLNQVIPDRRIIDLEFADKEMHPVDRSRKSSVYDMFCRTDDGSRIVVEIQRRKQSTYAERALYYSTFQISRQVEAGSGDYDFCPVYVISILDFDIDQNRGNAEVKTVYRLYEESTHSLLTDRLTFIFLELSKFRKSKEELSGDILEGMYFCFKNMSSLQERPDALNHDIFRKIFEVSELLNMDAETRSKVIEKMTTERDLRNQMAYARKEAIEEGKAEGKAEGSRTKAEEIAKNLKAKGMSDEEIASIVGLDIEIVSSL